MKFYHGAVASVIAALAVLGGSDGGHAGGVYLPDVSGGAGVELRADAAYLGDSVKDSWYDDYAIYPSPADFLARVPGSAAFTMPSPEGDTDDTEDSVQPVAGGQNSQAVPEVQPSVVEPVGVDPVEAGWGWLVDLVCTYDWSPYSCEKILHLIWCESGGRPDAHSGYYVGLMQIDPYLHGHKGDIYSAAGNVAVGHIIFLERGRSLGAWPRCQYAG